LVGKDYQDVWYTGNARSPSVETPEVPCMPSKNYQYTKHTKHIEIHHDFMRDRYAQGVLDFDYVEGKVNLADIFTKALPKE
jgi:hypothetical protein